MNKVFLRSSMDESNNDTTKMDESRLSNKEYGENQIASNAFWYILQDEKGTEIPPYVKNICTFNNLDNPLTFRHITDDTIKELEDFAQNQMKDFLQPGDNYELYFGRYHKMPDKFRFLIGDRFLIKELVEFVKSKPDQFWKTISVPLPAKKICLRNYVSSDNEDDELQTSTPPNPEKESKELTLLAKRALMKENFGSKAKNQAMLNKVEAKVTVKTIAGGPKGVDAFIMTGTVKCVLCPQKLVIRKTFASGTKKPRWVASNYRRHIRYHLDGRLKRMMPELPEATEKQLDAITSVICKSEEFVDADQEDTEDTMMHEEETFVETWQSKFS